MSFNNDLPLKNLEEDKLNRTSFAQDIADSIIKHERQQKNSLVISLNGSWGYGKTTIKNFILHYLETDKNEDEILILEFNPWEWSSQGKIFESFFNELAPQIGLSTSDPKDDERLRHLAQLFISGKHVVSKIFPETLNAFLPFLIVLGVSPGFIHQSWFTQFSALMIALFASVAFILQIKAEWNDFKKEPLATQRKNIENRLGKANKRILVVIDDIDRLIAEQTRMIFQLVKANANFPNIVYLLLFQKDIVEKQLDDVGQSGREYLEKIVQVPFDIPAINQKQINHVLFEGLDQLIHANEYRATNFEDNKDRWHSIFLEGVQPFFQNLRNVYRFLSILSLSVSRFDGEKAYEINIVDLILIEVLRIFEPDLYMRIKNNQSFFLQTMRNVSCGDHNDLLSLHLKAATQADVARCVLFNLFPKIDRAYWQDSEFEKESFEQIRVCNERCFPRYFSFSLSAEDLSDSEFIQITSFDKQGFYQKLEELEKGGKLENFLLKLYSWVEEPDVNEDLLVSLMDYGDRLFTPPNNPIEITLHHRAGMVIERYCSFRKSGYESLLEFINKTTGFSITSFILHRADNEKIIPNRKLVITDKSSFDKLRQVYLKKVREKIHDSPNQIIHNNFAYWILRDLKRWGKQQELEKFVIENISSVELLLAFVNSLKNNSHDREGIHIQAVYEIVPQDTVKYLIGQSSSEKLTEEQKNLLGLIQEEIKRFDEDN